MNRKEVLQQLVNQAQFNGFEFRRWFQSHVKQSWPGADQALTMLLAEGRFYSLLFSHDFASSFWRTGAEMSFEVPSTSYQRVNTRGEVIRVTRKPFTRRMIKRDVWRYHLHQMAMAEDPILYLCRYLPKPDRDTQGSDSHPPIALQA
jgi:hypothetical protein